MANNLLTIAASDAENGIYPIATKNAAGVVRIMVANLKYRDDRITELVISLPASVAGIDPVYYLIDAGHSDYFDQGGGAGTLESVPPPPLISGTVTLQMQPRSVHLLEFIPASASTKLTLGGRYGYNRRFAGYQLA